MDPLFVRDFSLLPSPAPSQSPPAHCQPQSAATAALPGNIGRPLGAVGDDLRRQRSLNEIGNVSTFVASGSGGLSGP